MFQLSINQQPVVIKDGTSFKLTRENPALTESGDHTLEVTLPLRGCPRNTAVLGHLHRIDQPHSRAATERLPFRLVADQLTLEGTAVVTSLSEEDARLQLIAGRSLANLNARDEELGLDRYIDELDLGRAWDSAFPIYAGHDTYPATMEKMIIRLSFPNPLFTEERRYRLRWGSPDETDCVLFPIYSTKDSLFANPLTFNDFTDRDSYGAGSWRNQEPTSILGIPLLGKFDGDTTSASDVRRFYITWAGENTTWYFYKAGVIAPQPYLSVIVERVLRAIGLDIDSADNYLRDPDSPFYRLFIANARGTLHYAQMLPHWTVRDFLTEVQRFCGVWVEIEGTTARIRPQVDVQDVRQLQHIRNVVDTHTFELSADETQPSTATASVAYAFTDPADTLFLPTDVWEQATVVDVDTVAAIAATPEFDAQDHSVLFHLPSGEYYTLFADADGGQHIGRVNHMGALQRDTTVHSNDADLKLRIVPAAMNQMSVRWHIFHSHPTGAHAGQFQLGQYDPATEEPAFSDFTDTDNRPRLTYHVLTTAATRAMDTCDPIDIQATLAGTAADTTAADEAEKPDILEVALNLTQLGDASIQVGQMATHAASGSGPNDLPYYPSDGPAHSFALPLAVGIPYTQSADIPGLYERCHPLYPGTGAGDVSNPNLLAFDLARTDGAVRQALDTALPVDKHVRLRVDFTDTTPFDPVLPFLIRGRRYACESLEYTIDDRGIQPLRRGNFYELQE